MPTTREGRGPKAAAPIVWQRGTEGCEQLPLGTSASSWPFERAAGRLGFVKAFDHLDTAARGVGGGAKKLDLTLTSARLDRQPTRTALNWDTEAEATRLRSANCCHKCPSKMRTASRGREHMPRYPVGAPRMA